MDIELYFAEYGSGFPFVLLHGNGGSSEYFKNQLEDFSKSYRVITVDTRGHGNSPRGTAPFTLSQFADDLKEFLDCRKIAKIHLLGFSDGANIAMLFALKYPEYIEKLILDGGNLCSSGVKAFFQIPVEFGFLTASVLSRKSKDALKKKEMLSLMIGQPNIKPRELGALKMPTLVMAGTADVIKDKHTRLIASSIPGAKLCILKGPHSIAEKNSTAFNKAVLDFLNG